MTMGVVHIRLIYRILTIMYHLPFFQPLSTVEHSKNNQSIGNNASNPLPCPLQDIQRRNRNAGPEQDLTEIVGAADNSVKLFCCPFRLQCALLLVCNRFQPNTNNQNRNANPLRISHPAARRAMVFPEFPQMRRF